MGKELNEFWKAILKQSGEKKNWRETFPICNSLNMFEMLRGLDSMARRDLEQFRADLNKEEAISSIKYIRIEYAADVVYNRHLPANAPGDLRTTGQVTDAVNFLAELKKIPQSGPKFGSDGAIPPKLKDKLHQAIRNAWSLNSDLNFIDSFKSTVNILTPHRYDSTVYAKALNNQVLHYAATSGNAKLKQVMAEDKNSLNKKAIVALAQAYTFADEPNTWFLESAFKNTVEGLTAILIHELTHTVGVPGFALAEKAVLVINEKSPYKIPKVK